MTASTTSTNSASRTPVFSIPQLDFSNSESANQEIVKNYKENYERANALVKGAVAAGAAAVFFIDAKTGKATPIHPAGVIYSAGVNKDDVNGNAGVYNLNGNTEGFFNSPLSGAGYFAVIFKGTFDGKQGVYGHADFSFMNFDTGGGPVQNFAETIQPMDVKLVIYANNTSTTVNQIISLGSLSPTTGPFFGAATNPIGGASAIQRFTFDIPAAQINAPANSEITFAIVPQVTGNHPTNPDLLSAAMMISTYSTNAFGNAPQWIGSPLGVNTFNSTYIKENTYQDYISASLSTGIRGGGSTTVSDAASTGGLLALGVGALAAAKIFHSRNK